MLAMLQPCQETQPKMVEDLKAKTRSTESHAEPIDFSAELDSESKKVHGFRALMWKKKHLIVVSHQIITVLFCGLKERPKTGPTSSMCPLLKHTQADSLCFAPLSYDTSAGHDMLSLQKRASNMCTGTASLK